MNSAVSCSAAFTSTLPSLKGDVNGDGAVNIFDALAILRHAVTLDPWPDPAKGVVLLPLSGALLGTTVTQTVNVGPGGTVTDTRTGAMFIFPEGGNGDFSTLRDKAPPAGHKKGMCYAKRGTISLVDDYAYFFESMLVGGWKPLTAYGWEGAPWLKREASEDGSCNDFDPIYHDLPGMEGFGTQILGSLDRATVDAKGWIFDFTGTVQQYPEPTGVLQEDIVTVISKGATEIEDLVAVMEKFYTEKKVEGGFAVLAELLGWSYYSDLTVVNKPTLPNVDREYITIKVAPRTVNAITYPWLGSYNIDVPAKGNVRVMRLLPGKNDITVRLIQRNGQGDTISDVSAEKSVTIEWSWPTNQSVPVEIAFP